jgi:hypothetical protein
MYAESPFAKNRPAQRERVSRLGFEFHGICVIHHVFCGDEISEGDAQFLLHSGPTQSSLHIRSAFAGTESAAEPATATATANM